MKYFVTDRNDEVLGPYSVDDITKLIASGSVEKTALACEEGSETWQPLASVLPPVPAAVPQAAPDTKPKAPLTPPRTPHTPTPKRDVNVGLLVVIVCALALLFLAAYLLGTRL